jgi:hypothetical protein
MIKDGTDKEEAMKDPSKIVASVSIVNAACSFPSQLQTTSWEH